jgi:hypothetical protein
MWSPTVGVDLSDSSSYSTNTMMEGNSTDDEGLSQSFFSFNGGKRCNSASGTLNSKSCLRRNYNVAEVELQF